jgi:hypothetical protein
MIYCFCRDLSGQQISEGYDILLGDIGDRVIRTLAEEVQELRETAAIKNHCRRSSLRFLGLKPIVQIFPQAGPYDFFARKFLVEPI